MFCASRAIGASVQAVRTVVLPIVIEAELFDFRQLQFKFNITIIH